MTSPTAARDALDVLHALHADTLTPQLAARWPGWGRVAAAFDAQPTGQWADFIGQVAELVDDDAFRTARESCDTSFYTPDWLAGLIWQLIVQSGFSGGRVFYPGVGGAALATSAPADLPIEWTGVEIDHVSAAVAACRVPQMSMITGPLQHATIATASYDLAIANVPYSSGWVRDAAGGSSQGLHNYFLTRMISAVRPGGLVVVLTSRHTVDSSALSHRPEVELSGMIRLPAGTFDGTDVVADLLVLRRVPATGRDRFPFRTVLTDFGTSWPRAKVAQYWLDHPDRVAGTMETTGNRHAGFLTVTADDPRAAAETAAAALSEVLLPFRPGGEVPELEAPPDADGRKEGSYHIEEAGTVVRIVDGTAVPVKANAELRALIELRDLTKALLELEADHTLPDDALNGPRERLAAAYKAYTDHWGPLGRGVLHEGAEDPETGRAKMAWRRPRMGGFRGDPDAHLVWSIEQFDPGTGTACGTAILSHRVNRPVVRPTSADTPAAAVAISLAETGRIDLDRVAGLLGCPAAAVGDQLAGLAFFDPDQQCWVRRIDYLSGDVTAKLAAAAEAGLTENADALTAVLPTPLVPAQIRPRLGAPWVPAADVATFLTEVLGHRASVEHCPATSRWEVTASVNATTAPLAFTVFGTDAMSGYSLAEDALNGKTPVVTKTERGRDGTVVTVRDVDQTMAAQEKLEQLQERFGTWLWEDPERAARLIAEYNHRFNRHVPRIGDGDYLTFPGMTSEEPLWPWQRRMVDRVINTPATLCGHAVGAGKTRTMLAAAWMLRRFGLATKPMIVVPNHLLEQIAATALQLFPGGKWLIAGRDDLAGDARRLFAARCATGDWDGVIITQAGFGLIPVHPSVEERWLLDQKDDLDAALRADSTNYWSGKQIARKVRGLETRLENLRYRAADPSTIWWEQLGVDHLSVDEADAYLRLPITTAATGFSMGSSKRATDLLLKLAALRGLGDDRPHFAAYTGTPWRNTIAETFVWQTYLQPDRLADAGVALFDSWAAQFVTMKSRVEPSPDGSGLRITTRPTRLQNVADLFRMLDEVADILPSSELPLDRPDHTVETVMVQPSAAQRRVTAQLIERSSKLQSTPDGDDNMLAICGDGRRSALDPQLVGAKGTAPKVRAVAQRVARIWQENTDRTFPGSPIPGVLQIVFCDQGTPRPSDPQTYGRVRAALLAHGVPSHLIRFVHDATDDKAKARLFAQCRTGEVQVLLASTEKAGLGTNMQDRLAAIHHLDAPWRPADIEQREGRALRPGNLVDDVLITRYVTAETFDTYMWSVLTRKASWIEQVTTNRAVRDLDDIGEVEVDYARVAAAAAGDERLFRRAELADTLRRLRITRSVDAQSAVSAKRRAEQNRRRAQSLRSRADHIEPLAEQATPPPEPDTLASIVRAIRRLSRRPESSTSARKEAVRWRNLTVTVSRRGWDNDNSTVDVAITSGYREVEQWTFTAREASRRQFGPDLTERLNRWVDQLPQMPARLRADAAECDTNAELGDDIANGWTFTKQAELDAAEAELAQLDTALANDAKVA